MTPEPVGWIPLVLSVAALILALAALTGFLYLLFTSVNEPDPEPPDWVNDRGRLP
jgi:hypothetical protein